NGVRRGRGHANRPQERDVLSIIGFIIIGIIAGYLGRLLMPGKQKMGFFATALLGMVGSLVGGTIAALLFGGDLELSVPRDLSATVRGESFSGTLRAPGARINTARHGPGSDFEHRYGGGDGRISIETFSGNAALRMD
ncbi:MAG: hypothetical protein KY442_06105, partial [Proteobacteria bacterium]|nr:hypothetical protein [Pseudomonadota bacterium]